MKRSLILMILLLACTTVAAQPKTLSKPVVCDDKEKVFKSILGDFKETPQWMGLSPESNSRVVLTVNLKTGSWTLIEYDSVTACIIAVGENSTDLKGTAVQFKSTNGSLSL